MFHYKTAIIVLAVLISATAFVGTGNAMDPGQPPFISNQCSPKNDEAEKIFQLGVDYHLARKGMPYDPERAEKLYEEALNLGNPKAAMNLAFLYRKDYAQLPHRQQRLEYSVGLLNKAAEMGCSEALYSLAEYYSFGWGVAQDSTKAEALVKDAVDKGSFSATLEYAKKLDESGDDEKARVLLEKSLAQGNGDAGAELSFIYWGRKDAENLVRVLRKGASLGSLNCLYVLRSTYNGDGQPKDERYVRMISDLLKSIDSKEAPRPIMDLDKRLFRPSPWCRSPLSSGSRGIPPDAVSGAVRRAMVPAPRERIQRHEAICDLCAVSSCFFDAVHGASGKERCSGVP